MLTDDSAARLAAQRLGFEVHGTIGIILRSLRRKHRSKRQVLSLLRSLTRRSTLFIEARLLNEIIEEVKKG